jgi:hypothetical protein
MLSGRSFSQKILCQVQKDVTSRIIPTNIQKLLIVFYGLLKMTTDHNFTQKCRSCEEFRNLFLILKEREEQLKQQINFASQHRLHQQVNQIKSVDTKLKTGIAESLREPLMKMAQKLLISDKTTFDQLTTEEQNLWTRFETGDIYKKRLFPG